MYKRFLNKIKPYESRFRRTSYAQCGEDLIIDFFFNCIGVSNPGYIDIGAHHPHFINNTYLFYKKGCRGINVEPDPYLYKLFEKYRPEDVNLNIGVAAEEGIMKYYQLSSSTLNTFSQEDAIKAVDAGYNLLGSIETPVKPVNQLLSVFSSNNQPYFMSLDVEGMDMIILEAINYDTHPPALICVETAEFSNKKICDKKNDAIAYLREQDYLLYADTYMNSILVRNSLVN